MVIVYRIRYEDTHSKEALSEVYRDIFEKHKPDANGNVVILYDDFEYWRSRLEKMLYKEVDKGKENQRYPTITNVHIVNTSINNREKTFVEELRHVLDEEVMIKVTETENVHSEMSEYGGSIILIVNIKEDENVQQAVDKCLHGIRDKELPSPSSSASNELNSNDFHGNYSKISAIIDVGLEFEPNKNALQTIKDFCLKSKGQQCQIDTSSRSTPRNIITRIPIPKYAYRKQEDEGALYIKDPCDSEAVNNFVDRFLVRMKDIGIPLEKISVDDITKLHENDNLIVICNNGTRILSDLENSLKGVRRNQYWYTVVIVLHVGHKAPVSTEYEISNSLQFRDLRKSIDMMYDSEDGIYSCKLNSGAYKSLKYLYPVKNTCCRCCIL